VGDGLQKLLRRPRAQLPHVACTKRGERQYLGLPFAGRITCCWSVAAQQSSLSTSSISSRAIASALAP